ncbi:phage terminase large subunit family protein [Methylocystis suflitae]|uniref:phage terminase large subunit family protein n=1 Tax=Methylocystis suflitae TaxID=2951405 RepID=UPI0021089B3A|nr:phage terminase large subunit family protein [Methylocystis suflitae]MCQ4191019.1 phage terminase large subunit family protein [Methylocystis suflitae]
MTTLATVRKSALRNLIPPARLRLSQWIEENITLPEGTSALPGKVRLWPYQREIADAIADPSIERVTLVKPVRVGFTTLLTSAIGSYIANEPAPILALLPTEADCRDYMVSEVEPIFDASPALRGALSADCVEGERNTLLSKRFPGGSLKVVASKAPRNLRRHTARVLLCDEVDAMEISAEGNPIRLAERRTLSFPNRKIIIGSTPIFEDSSHVLRAYAESDQRIFEIPCASCGSFTEILWANIEWPPDHPQDAAFRCPHCNELIGERNKAQMVNAGRWRALRPEVTDHAGFRLNALVSLLANASWGKLAQEFLAAKDDPSELQTFINTILAQGWREAGSELDETSLAARGEPFGLNKIPEEVLTISVGVDAQDDRLECTLAGWSRHNECYVLAHIVLWGSIDDDSTFLELDELLRTKWTHPYGGKLGVDSCVIDAGDGGHFDRILTFCAARSGRRVMAGKGVPGFARPAIQASKSKIRGGGRLWLVGVDVLKSTIFDRLQRGRLIRFSNELEPTYYEQLSSERRVVRYVRGKPTRRFERIPGARAETLDALVYAHAARSAAPIQFDQRESELRQQPQPPAPTVYRSAWMSR